MMKKIIKNFNLKTCLFGLIALVVGLTILFIAKFQPSSAVSLNSWSSAKGKDKLGYKDEDVSAYYNVAGQHQDKVDKVLRNNVLNKIVGSDADYPFDDFVNHEDHEKETSKNKAKTKGGKEDDFDGYNQGFSAAKDEDRNKARRLATINNIEKKLLPTSSVFDITCDINNGKYILECKKDDSEVYVPFSFLRKYFEVFGKMSDHDETKFIWLHSQAKIYKPKTPYDPKGVFTYFENYNVEVRDRVKCISGEGVPVSTQWDRNGYFYPVQIAQFGLAHYSKSIAEEGEPERLVLENGGSVRGKWIVQSKSDMVVKQEPLHLFNNIVQIQHTSPNHPATLKLDNPKSRLLTLSWDMKTDTSLSLTDDGVNNRNFNVTITAVLRYDSQMYYLHYITTDLLLSVQDNHIYHGLGKQSFSKWQHVIRDLGVDVQKGVSFTNHRKSAVKAPKIIKSKLILDSITLSVPPSLEPNSPTVRLYLDNMTLSANEHLSQFFQAADWFVRAQDERGGWPVPVRRKFAPDFYPVLESGWYSAMGQGHALSVLSRAYSLTKKSEYATACAKAVEKIFDLPGNQHGVRAVFMDKFVWYEEYPTTPSTFVLNGFMYALLGLYDVKSLKIPSAWAKAKELYDSGVISLKTMLPLYDTGSGTMYDLRHFTVPGITPNPARLDYHVTHINQLLTFATFEKDPVFSTTAERWIGYTEGDISPHN